MVTIPKLIEDNIKAYLDTLDLSYPVFSAFSTGDFALPCVLVKSGKLNQMEPTTGVFEGLIAISIISQIDENTLQNHDDITAAIYDAMASDAVKTSFNTNGHLWFCELESIENDKEERSLITILEYQISAQNLTL